MKGKKIVLGIVSVILFLVLAFCLTWCIINFDLVKLGLSGTQLYTKQDVDNAYNDGMKQSFKDKEDYLLLIDNYKAQIETLQDKVSKDSLLLKQNSDKISNLEINLSSAIAKRDEYKSQLDSTTKANAELQAKYDLEVSKVTSLKSQITQLNAEKEEINANLINARSRINELTQTINGYEETIANMLAENQVIARYYYDNSLYSLMVVQKGSKIAVSDPANTPTKTFLGWLVNNELVDKETYVINVNTTFVAKINNFYNVNFVVDGTNYDSDLVVSGAYSKTPTAPTKVGYAFDGWAIDNVVYNVDTYPITKNTTFTAKFTKINSVKFVFKETEINTQSVRSNEFANDVIPDVDSHTQFNYWTADGVRVDVATYPITKDTIFVANITNKYDVSFVYEETNYATQIVLDGSCALSTTPDSTKFKVFKGWSLDKITIVDVTKTPITKNTTFYAVIDYYYIVTFKIDDDSIYGTTQLVLKNTSPEVPANPNVDGYDFDFWTKDRNTQVDVSKDKITADTIYYAKLTKLHNVGFYSDDVLITSESVRNNEFVNLPANPTKTGYTFKGWSLDKTNIISNIDTIAVTNDVNYYAVFVEKTYTSEMTINGSDFVLNRNVSGDNDVLNLLGLNTSSNSYNILSYSFYDSEFSNNSEFADNIELIINFNVIGSISYKYSFGGLQVGQLFDNFKYSSTEISFKTKDNNHHFYKIKSSNNSLIDKNYYIYTLNDDSKSGFYGSLRTLTWDQPASMGDDGLYHQSKRNEINYFGIFFKFSAGKLELILISDSDLFRDSLSGVSNGSKASDVKSSYFKQAVLSSVEIKKFSVNNDN